MNCELIVSFKMQFEGPETMLELDLRGVGMFRHITLYVLERLKLAFPAQRFAQNHFGALGTNIFVFHIPSEWDDKVLEVYFEPFGFLTSVRIRKESATNRTLGFG